MLCKFNDLDWGEKFINCIFFFKADAQGNNLRKQQRNNDELQEQLENLQVQLNHAQNR